jgi:hypothetical protein
MRFTNASALIGFFMKQPILLSGWTSFAASIFISPAVIKPPAVDKSFEFEFHKIIDSEKIVTGIPNIVTS